MGRRKERWGNVRGYKEEDKSIRKEGCKRRMRNIRDDKVQGKKEDWGNYKEKQERKWDGREDWKELRIRGRL